jgi:hypothetical protein
MLYFTCTALQTIALVSSRSVQTIFTARVGGTAVLPCPIPPGALSQYYSVIWMKDGVKIIEAVNPQTITLLNGNSRLDLDDAYSLVIHSVNLNDSSSNYRCRLFITNPNTDTKQEVQSYPDRDIPLTLNITGMSWNIHTAILVTVMIDFIALDMCTCRSRDNNFNSEANQHSCKKPNRTAIIHKISATRQYTFYWTPRSQHLCFINGIYSC